MRSCSPAFAAIPAGVASALGLEGSRVVGGSALSARLALRRSWTGWLEHRAADAGLLLIDARCVGALRALRLARSAEARRSLNASSAPLASELSCANNRQSVRRHEPLRKQYLVRVWWSDLRHAIALRAALGDTANGIASEDDVAPACRAAESARHAAGHFHDGLHQTGCAAFMLHYTWSPVRLCVFGGL